MLLKVRHKRSQAVYQTEKSIISRMYKIALLTLGLISTHILAMCMIEQMSLIDAVWLTFTTITTVGYGDHHAQTTMGKITTIVLMYIFGIGLLAQMVNDFVEWKLTKREKIRKGEWDWNMKKHIIIINAPRYNCEQFFLRLVTQIRQNEEYEDIGIEILTEVFPEGLPGPLRELGVVHYHGTADNLTDLHKVDILDAQHILVLAKHEYERTSDSITFDIAYRLKELEVINRTFIECVLDENRSRLYQLGASAVLRPIRSYPEIIVRSLIAPGSEAILEDFFTHQGDHPRRYNLSIDNVQWSKIACQLIERDIGTPMAYIDERNNVIPQPAARTKVKGKALIIMVKEHKVPKHDEVLIAINQIA